MNSNFSFTVDESPGNSSAEEPAGILCPTCLQSNAPFADFCEDCGAPLSAITTIDPLRSTIAEGFAYRQAIHGHPRFIVLVGVWLIFLPGLLALPLAWTGLRSYENSGGVFFVVPYFLISAGIIYQVTANYIRKRRAASPEPAFTNDPA